jgi:hypothetical protein
LSIIEDLTSEKGLLFCSSWCRPENRENYF